MRKVLKWGVVPLNLKGHGMTPHSLCWARINSPVNIDRFNYTFMTDGSGGHQLYDAVLDDQGGEGLRANLGAEGDRSPWPHTVHNHCKSSSFGLIVNHVERFSRSHRLSSPQYVYLVLSTLYEYSHVD